MQKIDLSDLEMAQLREQLGRLPEPRGGRRQLHPLPTVLTIALAATLAGARGYLAISEYAARLTQPQLKRLRAYQASLRSRERFWDIRVPKIDSIFDNSLVPRPSWSPGVPPQHRKLVAATHRSPI